MTARATIVMPRLNANDDDGLIVRWLKKPGQLTVPGDLIAQVETSKAAVDIQSDVEGFFFPLFEVGARPAIGVPIAWITSVYDHASLARELDAARAETPPGLRLVSRKAFELMRKTGLNIGDITGNGPIRSSDVEKALAARRPIVATPYQASKALAVIEKSVVLVGAAEQGAVVLDCLLTSKRFAPLCFVDEHPDSSLFVDLPVFTPEVFASFREREVRYAHVCIGSPEPKLRIVRQLKAKGFEIVQAIHPSAVISSSALIGEGAYVGPGVVIGPGATIGEYSIINSNATIPHHVRIGAAARISDGANIAGGVTIGDRTLIGLGVTVNTGCHIGADVTVVSGVSVFNEIPDNSIVRAKVSNVELQMADQ